MIFIFYSYKIISTISLSPYTTLTTPFGIPVSFKRSKRIYDVSGTFSDGLSIKVLPQEIEIGNIHKGIMAGKLKGAIPAVIPNGTL